ncbi:hypothetical protein EZBTHKR_0917 [Elizabethkingia anophelis]|nr:hypothetical protein EZBTHKR_0917 [Elizabethkingia anophelis]
MAYTLPYIWERFLYSFVKQHHYEKNILAYITIYLFMFQKY